ncbi:type IV pilus biogenesis/stability protein PilW [Curvibacter delicatus]|jgi:type IV pilus assembly protein PilF|uniref:type IV pilus biogenesis/stability protein PilW n=1 Tax=Curvibacter delicatus TaxID=80879 RepID=UPI00082BA1C3|nr:type IV pilus biogenesis/stability protein PilW [Curvibacter delicatus]
MKMSEAGSRRMAVYFWSACLALVAIMGLSGCVTTGAGPANGSHTDIVTDSDEPEVRKRARIRLELAIGYFEQGQTTVALDEIKQALVVDPAYAEAYNLRGLIYMRLNDLRLAEESFRRAMALNPRDANVTHNYGWLLCQQARYTESFQAFTQAIANPTYGGRAKTWMAQGLCQVRAGQRAEAEYSLTKSYELDAANPVTGYNLASLLFQRGELDRAQFYIRRLNNSELANAESLWLGIKIEQRLNNREAREQLATQLKKRYPQSREVEAYERGAFNE